MRPARRTGAGIVALSLAPFAAPALRLTANGQRLTANG